MPWVNGILSIVYLAIASCLVVSCLKITHSILSALVAGLMVSLPIVASTLAYMQSADGYFFCLMLACLTAFLASRYKYGYIVGIAPLTLSMGGYQAYYGVTAGLMILILIIEVLQQKITWKKILVKGLKFLTTLGISMGAYLLIVKITSLTYTLTSYQGIDKMGQLSLAELPDRIYSAYTYMWDFFAHDSWNIHHTLTTFMLAISFIISIYFLVLLCIRKRIHKKPLCLALLIGFLVAFPLGCNIIFVMVPSGIHFLMLYGTVIMLLFPIAILNTFISEYPLCCNADIDKLETHKKIIRGSLPLFIITSLIVCIYNYGIVSNQAYLKQYLAYEKMYAQSVALISRIQGTKGYTTETEIVLIGKPQSISIPETNNIILTGINNDLFGLENKFIIFSKQYMNFIQPIVNIANVSDIQDEQAAKTASYMPLYPNDGSVEYINGRIYVKFS